MRILSRRSATLAMMSCAALASRPAAAAVDPSDQTRIADEAVKAYLAKSEAEKTAASDKLVGVHRGDLIQDPHSGILGNPQGDVTIVEFFDYNCPFSRRVEPRVQALLKSDAGVKLIPREFIIEGVPSSPIAGRAALASLSQGKYAPYHQAMMTAAEFPLSVPRVFEIAQSVGLDVDRLRTDMEAPAIYAQVIANFNLARALRIFQTPTFVAGNHIVTQASADIDFPALAAFARKA